VQPKRRYPSISVAVLHAGRRSKEAATHRRLCVPQLRRMIHIWDLSMLGTGLAVVGHGPTVHLSRSMILTIALFARLFAVLHELVCCFGWSSLTGWWLGRKGATLGRSAEGRGVPGPERPGTEEWSTTRNYFIVDQVVRNPAVQSLTFTTSIPPT
jgi:hypothetical protein